MTGQVEPNSFQEKAAAWFAEHGNLRGSAPNRSREPAAYIAAAREYQRSLYDAGLAGITWPPEYGGLGLGSEFQCAFDSAAQGYETFRDVFTIGLGMCAPALLSLGTEQQKHRYIEPMLRGDEVWCQLFSEPGAGSDLASLSTSAVHDGQGWVVNGQKVWTTFAQYSDFGLLLTRTNPDAPKHRGITMFVADLHAPGLTIRPLTQATGDREFNEVFADDVRIPDDQVVGAVDDGWRAAVLMLSNERVALGDNPISSPVTLAAVVDLIQRRGLAMDPVIRKRLAEIYVAQHCAELFAQRIANEVRVGKDPGSFASIGKLAGGRLARATAALALEVAGPDAVAWDPAEPDAGVWAYGELFAPSLSIAGGTDHIQRTVLAERVLGLPREPQPDKEVPFRELRRPG